MNFIVTAKAHAATVWTAAALCLFGLLAWDVIFWDSGSIGFERAGALEAFVYDPSGGNQRIGLLVSGWMIWRRRGRLAAARADATRASRLLSAILVTLCLGLRSWAAYTGATDLQLPALALLLIATGAMLAGAEGVRILSAPAAVLLLTMPIPVAIVNWLIYPMQRLTAEGTSVLLDIVGIQHQTFGEQIFTRENTFYVIEGCAGLRAVQALTLATVAYVDVSYRNRRQALILASAVPIVAMATNQLRVLSIILDPFSNLSGDHATQGLIMIVAGVVLIAAIDSLLQRLERRGDRPVQEDGETGSPMPNAGEERPAESGSGAARTSSAILVPILLFGAIYATVPKVIPKWTPPAESNLRMATFPKALDDWKAIRTLKLDREFLGSITWSDWLHRRYRSGSDEIDLLVLADDHQRRDRNVLSFKTALAHPGFSVRSRRAITLGASARAGTELELQGRGERLLVLSWRISAGGRVEESLRSLLAADQSAFHRESPTLAVRIAIPLTGDPAEDRRRRAVLVSAAEKVDRALVDTGWAPRRISQSPPPVAPKPADRSETDKLQSRSKGEAHG